MKINYHASSFFQIRRFGCINAYFFAERDHTFTLIDTGMIGSGRAIINEAARLGRPLSRIVLTHVHGDHAGSLDYLVRQLPDVEVVVGEREARLLQRDFSLDQNEANSKIKGMFPRCRAQPTKVVGEGDRVGSLIVIVSPGHTPGHISLFEPASQILFGGDAFHSMFGGVSVASTPGALFPFLSMATWHAATTLESARRLLALEPEFLAPGHGPIVIEPAEAMRQAIAREEARLSERVDS